MNEQSRRQFMQSSAVALGAAGVVGAGIGQQTATAQEGSVPAFAEWVPEGETILNQYGEIDVGTYTFETQLELFGEVSTRGDTLLQLEPYIYTSSMAGLWRALTQINLAEPVFGSLVEAESVGDVDPSGIPVERHTLLGRTSVYTGPFDTDTIAETVQNSDAEETEYDGIYEYSNQAVITWGEGYLIQGDNQNIDQVAAIRNTGDGDQQPRYESTAELEALLTAVDHSGQTFLRLTDDGTLSTDQYSESIDHSPLAGATSYIGTLDYDSDTTEFDTTTVVQYPEDATIDTDQVAGMVTNELSREITTEGQTVRVTARYNRDDIGYSPDDGDDSDGSENDNGDNTDDGTDDGGSSGQNETDDQNMDGSETNESEDDSDSSDGSGPGFGVLSAVSGLGGAGYLLSRRLADDE